MLAELGRRRFIAAVFVLTSLLALPDAPAFAMHISEGILPAQWAITVVCGSCAVPFISTLFHEMKRYDGVPISGLPLTVGEARKRFMQLIPKS